MIQIRGKREALMKPNTEIETIVCLPRPALIGSTYFYMIGTSRVSTVNRLGETWQSLRQTIAAWGFHSLARIFTFVRHKIASREIQSCDIERIHHHGVIDSNLRHLEWRRIDQSARLMTSNATLASWFSPSSSPDIPVRPMTAAQWLDSWFVARLRTACFMSFVVQHRTEWCHPSSARRCLQRR